MPVDISTLASVMERNESYIFWLQPLLGNVQDQIPAISVNNSLYAINLRLEKAIFRRVRLCRNFCNIELMQDGTQKLRIPSRLLREKQRTSQRHMALAKKAKEKSELKNKQDDTKNLFLKNLGDQMSQHKQAMPWDWVIVFEPTAGEVESLCKPNNN